MIGRSANGLNTDAPTSAYFSGFPDQPLSKQQQQKQEQTSSHQTGKKLPANQHFPVSSAAVQVIMKKPL